MQCFYHENEEASAQCNNCNKELCASCANKYRPVTCTQCANSIITKELLQFVTNGIISFSLFLVFIISQIYLKEKNSFISTLLVSYIFAGLPFGWIFISKLTRNWILVATIEGWLKYYFTKFIFSFVVGVFVTPFVLLYVIYRSFICIINNKEIIHTILGIISIFISIVILISGIIGFAFGVYKHDSKMATPTPYVETESTVVPTPKIQHTPTISEQSEIPLSTEAIKNMSLKIDRIEETVQLENGKYKRDSPSRIYCQVAITNIVLGDLNSDSEEDAAVIYWYSGGGSGNFYYLTAMINKEGSPIQIGNEDLGDRVDIKDIKIESGKVIIHLINHNETEEQILTYKLEGKKLVNETGHNSTGSDTNLNTKVDPVNVIEENYSAINNKEFEAAYSLRSKSRKSKLSYNDFYKSWKDNISINLENAEIIKQTNEDAVIKVKLYSEDPDNKTGNISKDYYTGLVYLVKENGEWKLDDSKIEKEKSSYAFSTVNSYNSTNPVEILEENYSAIRNKDFMGAYNLRTEQNKAKQSYDKFCDIWSSNITIRLEDSQIITQTDETAKVGVRLYSEDNDTDNNKILKDSYTGMIYLIKEDGGWKINDAEINKMQGRSDYPDL